MPPDRAARIVGLSRLLCISVAKFDGGGVTRHHRILVEPKFHELRSQAFRHLAESELAQAKAARANLQTLDALQDLHQPLTELRRGGNKSRRKGGIV